MNAFGIQMGGVSFPLLLRCALALSAFVGACVFAGRLRPGSLIRLLVGLVSTATEVATFARFRFVAVVVAAAVVVLSLLFVCHVKPFSLQ